MCVSQQPELTWIPVGLWVLAACAGRSTRSKQGFPTNTWLLAPCQGLLESRAKRTICRKKRVLGLEGRGKEGRAAGQGRQRQTGPEGSGSPKSARAPQTLLEVPPDLPEQTKTPHWSWVYYEASSHFRPRIPGGFTLPHRFDRTLGRGPRSEPRAPMQMVSGALGSLGFRV